MTSHDLHVTWWQVSRYLQKTRERSVQFASMSHIPAICSFNICVLVSSLGVIIQNVGLYQTMEDYRGLTNFAGESHKFWPHLIHMCYVSTLRCVFLRFHYQSGGTQWSQCFISHSWHHALLRYRCWEGQALQVEDYIQSIQRLRARFMFASDP